MSLIAKLAIWALLTTFVVCRAQAQEIQIGTGIVCDTTAQIEQFVSLYEQIPEEAIQVVNAEAGKFACGFVTIMYLKGERTGTLKNGMLAIYEITVVGFYARGWHQLPPTVQYTIFENSEA